MMDAYNHQMLSGKALDMVNRLRWHWGVDLEDNYLNKCTKCGICEEACTQRLPIQERLEQMRGEVQKFLDEQKSKNSESPK